MFRGHRHKGRDGDNALSAAGTREVPSKLLVNVEVGGTGNGRLSPDVDACRLPHRTQVRGPPRANSEMRCLLSRLNCAEVAKRNKEITASGAEQDRIKIGTRSEQVSAC